MPGEEESGGEVGDPVVGQLRVQLGSVKQVRDDVVAWDPALALDQGAQVPPQ
ncbi:MAG: hypothetical protein ACRDST_20195 [Pseudonocardiaceae bacterium]